MTYLLACAGAYLATLLTVWLSARLTRRPHLGLAFGMFAISLAAITGIALALAGLAPALTESAGVSLLRASLVAGTYENGLVAFCAPLIAQFLLSLPFIVIMRESAPSRDETERDETPARMDESYLDDAPRSHAAASPNAPPGQRVEPTVY